MRHALIITFAVPMAKLLLTGILELLDRVPDTFTTGVPSDEGKKQAENG